MPAVISFWMLPEEESDFLNYVASIDDVVWMPAVKVLDRSLLIPKSIETLANEAVDSVLLGLRGTLDNISISTFSDKIGTTYAVTSTEVPILSYSRGKLNENNKLERSNICAQWTYLSEDKSEFLDFPVEFVKWGKKVIQWVRKKTPHWHLYKAYRTTSKVDTAIKEGLEIVP